MRWIVGKNVAVDINQLQARWKYIQRVTGSNVSKWNYMSINGKMYENYFVSKSDDGIDATVITAHIDDVGKLCLLKEICSGEFVVANTCIFQRMSHKNILHAMMKTNQYIKLWLSKQELSVCSDRVLRQTTTVKNIGRFGFQTSLSERELFRKREMGLRMAIQESYNHVSPVILLGD